MAESVDALVSNTSGATRAGSTPAQGTKPNLWRAVNLGLQRAEIYAPGRLKLLFEKIDNIAVQLYRSGIFICSFR